MRKVSLKNSTTYRTFYLEIYQVSVHVIIDNHWDKHKKIMEIFGDEEIVFSSAMAMNFTAETGFTEYLVAFTWPLDDHYIVHECLHLMYYISNHLGLEINSENTETGAYLIGILFKNIKRIAGHHETNKNKKLKSAKKSSK